MPAYITHIIMAKDLYEKIDKSKVSLNSLETFSLGGDLARFSKCRRISHKEKQLEYIDNMYQYINNNNLLNDKNVMGVFYGHICHYFLDKTIHPFIHKIDKECQNVGTKSHTLIEGYFDAYLVKYKYNISIEKFDKKNIFRGNNKNIKMFINYVYKKTYGIKNVYISYILSLFLYKNIQTLFILVGKKRLIKMSKFDKFFELNNLEKYNEEFIKLYSQSIDKTVEFIMQKNY